MSSEILGRSSVVLEMLEMIKRVAPAKSNVLICGESGTGKELIARMIHQIGPLKDMPFIPVNCGAIPENLIESEMFGHQKGSFTGAVNDKTGLFEAAHKGTLFLDEVGELPLSLQVKLLRAIQDKSFRKVGGVENIRVDVRIIAATNRDLEAAVKKGTFREDLYYRLNVILISAPPLRERKGDISILAKEFLKRFAEKAKKDINKFEPEVLESLEKYSWPGNIRELENLVERAVTLETQDSISFHALPRDFQNLAHSVPFQEEVKEIRLPAPDFGSGKIDLDSVLGEVEKIYLLAALNHCGGAKKKAASLLGVTFRSLRYRLKKLGIEEDDT